MTTSDGSDAMATMSNRQAPLPPRPLPRDAFLDPATYAATRLPVDFASTIIPDAYTSEAFFELEQDRIFRRTWVPVCASDEVRNAGDFVVVEVGGQSVIVCRNRVGELRAHHNVCRHRGARLAIEERGHRDRFFQCPYHSWAYSLDGDCLGTPLFTPESGIPADQQAVFDMSGVKAFDRKDYPLHAVRIEACLGLIWLCLDPDTPPLQNQLGDLAERLAPFRLDEATVVRTADYEIDANWKLIAENFLEYYHLPWVHPELVKVSPVKDHYRWQGPGMYCGFCTTPIADNSDEGGWKGLAPLESLDPENRVSARFAWVLPTVAINALPNHTVFILPRPVSAARSSERIYLLAHPAVIEAAGGDAEPGIDALLEFWDLVNRQDVEIVERVQAGLSNLAYTGGRMCYRFEETLHRFQNLVIDRMLGVWAVPGGDAEPQTPMFQVG